MRVKTKQKTKHFFKKIVESTIQTQDFTTLENGNEAEIIIDNLRIINNYMRITNQVVMSEKEVKGIKHWEIVNRIEQWLVRNLLWDMIKRRTLVVGQCCTITKKKDGSPIVVKVNLVKGSFELDSRSYTAARRTYTYEGSSVLNILNKEHIPEKISIHYEPVIIIPANFPKRKALQKKGRFESEGFFIVRTFEPEPIG